MAAAGVNWVIGQTYTRSEEEYLEAARLCIDRGADVNAVNEEGFRAIQRAANRGFDAMIRLLADKALAGPHAVRGSYAQQGKALGPLEEIRRISG